MDSKLKLLRLQLITSSSSAPFNNFTMKTIENYDIHTISFATDLKIQTESLNFFDSNGSVKKFFKNLKYVLSKNNFDIIHIHSVHCGVIFILHTFFNLNFSLLKKTIFTVHNSYENYKLRNKIFFGVVYLFIKKIVYCSESSFISFPKIFSWNKKKNLVISNGVDLNKMSSLSKVDFDLREIDFVIVGRIEPVKNIILTSKILSLFKNKIIHIVGDGGQITQVKGILKSDNVIFHGQVERNKVYEVLSRSKFFISLSKTEGLPISLLEAIFMGCVPLVSNITSHKEIINDLTEFLIDTKCTPSEIKMYLDKLINKNQFEKARNKLFEKVKTNFSLDRMLSNYDLLYKKLLDEI